MFGTILLIFGMKYFSDVRQARSRVMSEDAYRELAKKAVSAQSETANSLFATQTQLAEIKTRLGAIETILKAVE